MAETIRVGCPVDHETHDRLKAVAERAKTTVGNVVARGVELVLDEQERDELSCLLQPDGRRKQPQPA